MWTKYEATKEGADLLIAYRREHKQPTAGYEKYSHSMYLVEIDCSAAKARLMNSIDYARDGVVLESLERGKAAEWISTPPQSSGEELTRRVCKQADKR